ncbi:hypothetical protein M9H77_29639 [Catharanthus roseus]|uniref:Uncharacterized protein n=1 Tax=Catharanthus roseus TaxID=4058 RepID=A0ACB9ZUZ5_CATRO|nr:hypothetical protein M9H77_29639 [Catharanthus roseus]
MIFERTDSFKVDHKSIKGGYHIRISFNDSPYRLTKKIFNQRIQIPFNFHNKKFSNKQIKKFRNHAPHRYPPKVETVKREQKWAKTEQNGSRLQRDNTYRRWQGNLPSTVDAEDA